MAINLNGTTGITTTGLTSNGIDDNATSTAMTLDTSGNVGIGTSSPAVRFHVSGSSTYVAGIEGSSAYALMGFKASGTTGTLDDANVAIGANENALYFRSGGAERMRLDSSGNVLVGKTSTATGAGFEARSDGQIVGTRSANRVAFLNRLTSNGDIIQFAKDGSTVGSIGTSASFYLASNTAAGSGGIRFGNDASTTLILPSTNVGANKDGDVNLGYSTSRFRNLYLSGGVFLGGTGSANKLSDYEEGSWTPSFNSAFGLSNITGFTNVEGKYVKIGDMVFAVAAFDLTKTSSETIAEGNYIIVSGLPIAGEKIGVQGINGLIGTINVYGSLGNNVNATGFAQLASTSTEFYFFIQSVNGAVDTDDHCFVNIAYST